MAFWGREVLGPTFRDIEESLLFSTGSFFLQKLKLVVCSSGRNKRKNSYLAEKAGNLGSVEK